MPLDLVELTQAVRALQSEGVAEVEFDAKNRLRRLVLRVPVASPDVPATEQIAPASVVPTRERHTALDAAVAESLMPDLSTEPEAPPTKEQG